jgi:D-tyrosyl-tRNA(Tyr) deacylase
MRALVQRVSGASVQADGVRTGAIGLGLLVYVVVGVEDRPQDAVSLARKVAGLRIFPDEQGKMNLSVREVGSEVLVVSNFTLAADASKGRRPSFDSAAGREHAKPLYDQFVQAMTAEGCKVSCGVFVAEMVIDSQAAGPVNLVIDMPPKEGPPQE